jgi:hypothetical protein
METLAQYQTLIKQALNDYAVFLTLPPKPPYQVTVVCDDEHHHYLVRKLGWTKKRRIRQTVLHVAIYEGKIRIEEDWTEEGIASYFLDHGVPEEDIILGFQPPQIRSFIQQAEQKQRNGLSQKTESLETIVSR